MTSWSESEGNNARAFKRLFRRLRSGELPERLKSAAAGRAVWIKANAGLPQTRDGRAFYTTTPAEFAAFVPALLEAGADFIGGCCGTTPEFIRAIRKVLDTVARS